MSIDRLRMLTGRALSLGPHAHPTCGTIWWWACALGVSLTLGVPAAAVAEESAPGRGLGPGDFTVIDRAVVRFSASEAGGKERPYFIYERELAFEARLQALSDPAFRPGQEAFRRHHLQ